LKGMDGGGGKNGNIDSRRIDRSLDQ
jgi:hypothetical protein